MSLQSLLAFTPSPTLSAVLLIILAVAVLYLARGSAHTVILTICEALHEAWLVKKRMSGKISNPHIDAIYDAARAASAENDSRH